MSMIEHTLGRETGEEGDCTEAFMGVSDVESAGSVVGEATGYRSDCVVSNLAGWSGRKMGSGLLKLGREVGDRSNSVVDDLRDREDVGESVKL